MKATLVCGVAFLLSRLCRRTRASIRHLLFALAFAALVAIPVAGTLLPPVAFRLPAAAAAPAPPHTRCRPRPRCRAQVQTLPHPALPGPLGTALRQRRPRDVAQVVTATWLTGVALFLIPVVIGFWQVRRLRQSALAMDRRTGACADRSHQRSACAVRLRCLLHEKMTGPMTCGVLKPSIILPAIARAVGRGVAQVRAQTRARARCTLGFSDALPVEDRLRGVLVPSAGLGRVAAAAIRSRAGV